MIYFDNAATTIHKPDCVINAVSHAMRSYGNPSRGAHGVSLDASRCVHAARKELAALLGAKKASSIAFASNATEALNTAIYGLFSEGDAVISTVCEHNSVLRPLYELERRGVRVDLIGADSEGRLLYEEAEALITARTRAMIVTHASNVTGNVTDLDFFSALAEKYGLLLIVDGAQAAGAVPVNVSGIDVYCFTGHKSLLGPQGTGGLYVREGLAIRPLKSGGSGIHSFDKRHPGRMPDVLEAGTLNCHGIAGLGAAVCYIRENETHKTASLMRRFCDGLHGMKNVVVYGDMSSERVPVVSLNIGDLDAGYVSDILWQEYGIAVRAGAHCAPLMHKALGTEKRGAVRFSFGIFNTEAEIDTAVNAIYKISDEAT